MNLISIHYGHNCTVAFSRNGVVEFAQSEERVDAIKNATGFPYKSINYIKNNFINNDDNTEVLIIDKTGEGAKFLSIYGLKPKPYEVYLENISKMTRVVRKVKRFFFNFINCKYIIEKKTKLDEFNIKYYDHHLSHAATPCLFDAFDDKKKWLIFTLDAEGDKISSGVFYFENKKFDIISSNDVNKSIGYIYSYTTEICGFKSNQHEFKIMGMAPHGDETKKKEIAKKIEQETVSFNNQTGEFESNKSFKDFKPILKNIYKDENFEDICAGVQYYLEEIVCKWVSFWIKKKQIFNVALSGGVFMNVKAAKKISELNFVDDQFVTPSCGDESLIFGALYLRQVEEKIKFKKIDNLYLGNTFTNEYIENYFKHSKWVDQFNYKKIDTNINQILANYLSEKKIIGRFCGKSEWGARALGNRSILCDPRNRENIDLLNKKIKSRDYWMPFAPSILFEDADLFFLNPKKINTDFMQTSFDATEFAKKKIPAAIHSKDFTLRPQLVKKDINLNYYNLITEFKKITNIGCLLNTSFNLHGYPNVGHPEHAFFTFKNSGLDILNIESYIFLKK